MNPFASGLLHPWMTPAHVLVVLALGSWLGQQTPWRLGQVCQIFVPSTVLALAATCWWKIEPTVLLLALALLTAALVATEKRLPGPAAGVLLAAIALALGADSGVEVGPALNRFATLAGTAVSLGLGLINIAYYVSLAAARPEQWIRIGLRIIGSWIVAIALLMLAFSFRPEPATAPARPSAPSSPSPS